VPTIAEWDDYLPRFRGSRYDHPGEHLLNFHRCMLEHAFVYEDVLIKLFKFSLEGHASAWCQSLPAASVHSLKNFHHAFNLYYKTIFHAENMFEHCCEAFHLDIQHPDKYVDEKKSIHDTLSFSTALDEYPQDMIDESTENCIAIDALHISSDAPTLSYLSEEIVVAEKVYDVLSPVMEEESHETACHFVQDSEIFGAPIFNEDPDEDEQIYTSNFVDLTSVQPVYDSYKSYFDEDIKDFQQSTIEPLSSSIEELLYVDIDRPRFAKDIEHDQFGMIEGFRSSPPFVAPLKRKVIVTKIVDELQGLHQQFKHSAKVFVSEFYDPVARYLEDFIHLNPLSFLHSKHEVQIHHPWWFEFENFVLAEHVPEAWLDSHLLKWLGWKSVYT